MELKEIVKKKAEAIFEKTKAIREHLHKFPELSFQEYETSKYLKEVLSSWNIEIDAKWVETGFSVVIDSGKVGKTIALRADLDALPIQEKNNTSYKSQNDGIMHACGHDVHSACLMGVAKILSEMKDQFSGKIILFFQAGEEKLPGGASLMIKEGIIDKYKPDAMIAQHVYPEFEAGLFGFREGMYMASADEVYLKVIGKGGHAALPHNNIDPIIIASSILIELQQITSRIAPPTLPTVLSFGKITGEGATNVIPSIVEIEGTLRTMNEEWREIFHNAIREISQNIAKSFGGKCEVEIKKGYPFLVNDETVTSICRDAANEYFGREFVKELDLRMTAEDFSYFSQHCPVCFYRLGVGHKDTTKNNSVHHPEFDIDSKSLLKGVESMTYLSLMLINKLNQSL